MSSFFDEKAHQVEPGQVVAFGINLISRYSKASELIEMLSFAQKAALADLAGVVKEVFYDSKASVCSFKFTRDVALGDHVEKQLFAIAMETINQFEWLDTVHHRGEEYE
ncbi:MAG: hypothetical protein R3E40_02790 [Rhodocyclaceae bacterium]